MNRPVVVHLDQFAWVQCARAHLGRPGGADNLPYRDELLRRVHDGTLLLPLSESHYFETWRQGSRDRRGELSAEMAMLTKFTALAPLRRLLGPEFDRAIVATFGERAAPRDLRALGSGADTHWASIHSTHQ